MDYNDRLVGPICRDGPHVNWLPATYAGRLFYTGGDKFLSDHDLDFILLPVVGDSYDAGGLTFGNVRNGDLISDARGGGVGFHVEFDREETIRRMTPVSGWWKQFGEADNNKKKNMVSGVDAVVTALLGLDCEHYCQTELHPVWGLAIRETTGKDDEAPSDDQEVWAFFVKTFGNQGGCSEGTSIPGAKRTDFSHYVDVLGNIFKIRIPVRWPSGAVASFENVGWNRRTANGRNGLVVPEAEQDGSSIIINVPLQSNSPESRPLVYGELILRRK